MDTATNLANDQFYLDNHLKDVDARREQQGEVEIYGLGVGLDLSPYYSRCLALDLSQGLCNKMFPEIIGLLGGTIDASRENRASDSSSVEPKSVGRHPDADAVRQQRAERYTVNQ